MMVETATQFVPAKTNIVCVLSHFAFYSDHWHAYMQNLVLVQLEVLFFISIAPPMCRY